MFFKAQTGSLLIGTISTYIICYLLSIIDQPNPELTKHFDWLPLYKCKTLWWSGRTKESSLIWNGKLIFLATLRTSEFYVAEWDSQASVNIFHPIDVDVMMWVTCIGYIPYSGNATMSSLRNQILNPPWVHPTANWDGLCSRLSSYPLNPNRPCSQGGNTRPRSMKLGKRKEVAAVCNKNDTWTTSSITSITSRESTRWWHSLQNKSR